MAEHVAPLPLNLLPVRRGADRVGSRNIDAGMRPLLRQHRGHHWSLADKIGMTVHVHYVLQVPWSTPLTQGTKLLPEQLDQRVADNSVARKCIAVLVSNCAEHSLLHQDFVGGDVHL